MGCSRPLLTSEIFAQYKEPFRLEEASFDRIVLDPPCTAYDIYVCMYVCIYICIYTYIYILENQYIYILT